VTETAGPSLLGRAGPEIRLDIHQLHLSNYSRVIHSQASIPGCHEQVFASHLTRQIDGTPAFVGWPRRGPKNVQLAR